MLIKVKEVLHEISRAARVLESAKEVMLSHKPRWLWELYGSMPIMVGEVYPHGRASLRQYFSSHTSSYTTIQRRVRLADHDWKRNMWRNTAIHFNESKMVALSSKLNMHGHFFQPWRPRNSQINDRRPSILLANDGSGDQEHYNHKMHNLQQVLLFHIAPVLKLKQKEFEFEFIPLLESNKEECFHSF